MQNQPDKKDSNPKDALGVRKVPLSTVPLPIIGELGLAMLEGALKYGRHNYRVIGVRASVYLDAAFRHLAAYWEGQDIDPDSGLPHLTKAMACMAIVRDAEIRGKLMDDRPPATPGDWIKELNKKAEELLQRYPNPIAPYLQKEIERGQTGTGQAPSSTPPSSSQA